MRRSTTALLALALALLSVACTRDNENDPIVPPADCDLTDVSYETRVEPIIASSCRGCHNSTTQNGGVSLATKQQVQQQANNGQLLDAVYGRNGVSQMPPSSALPDCDIAVLQKWVDDGAN